MWQSRSVWFFFFLITMNFNLIKNRGNILPKAKDRTGKWREFPKFTNPSLSARQQLIKG